jgi:hypothetical protein
VWLPDGRFLLAFGRGDDGDDEIACGPVRYAWGSPFELWRIAARGRGRIYARAEDVALARERFEEVSLGGSLRFTAWTEPSSSSAG